MNRRHVFSVVFLFMIAALWNVHCTRFFYLNFSCSVPRGIYLRVPQGEIRVGDCVVYLPTEETVGIMRSFGWLSEDDSPHLFLKYVGVLSGGRYTVSAKSFFVDGKYIGEVLPVDSEGHSLPLAGGTHIVPEGEFLPVSCSSRSFDGRYTGTVPLDRIVAKVIPVLVVD